MWLTKPQARANTNVWLTPRPILQALGPFDLDPCAAPAPRPWPTARVHYTEAEGDGLARPWGGFVWCNPPYGAFTGPWLAKMAEHQSGIALTFARTETGYFFDHAWKSGAGFLFVRGRIKFCNLDGSVSRCGMGPSVLIGYGEESLRRLARAPIEGHLVVNAAAVLINSDGLPVGTWREALELAAGGRTLRLRDIYAAAEGTAKVREAKARGHNWQAQVRRALQEYFTPVERGVWRTA